MTYFIFFVSKSEFCLLMSTRGLAQGTLVICESEIIWWYGIVRFNIPLKAAQVISETVIIWWLQP